MNKSVKWPASANICEIFTDKSTTLQRLYLLIYVWGGQTASDITSHRISLFWHCIFWETEVEFWHVSEQLAVGGYFTPVSLNEFWWAAVVQSSLTVPTSLCSFPVFMSDPQQPAGEALSASRSESPSVWSTSNIFEQFRQGWVQVIQSLPKRVFWGDERTRRFTRSNRETWFFHFCAASYSKTTHQHGWYFQMKP